MTRIWISILAGAALLSAAEKTAPKATATAARSAKPAKPAAKAPAAPVLPPGAVQIGPQTWRHTAADGRKWVYRKTPFGLVRYEETEAAGATAPVGERDLASIKVTEAGDTVHFERPSPFGVQKWTRKKAELDEVEKLALERSRGAAAGSGQK